MRRSMVCATASVDSLAQLAAQSRALQSETQPQQRPLSPVTAFSDDRSEAGPLPVEENMDAFRLAVLDILNANGGNMLGSALGAQLRQTFNFSKLLSLLKQIETSGSSIRIIYPGASGMDIRVCRI